MLFITANIKYDLTENTSSFFVTVCACMRVCVGVFIICLFAGFSNNENSPRTVRLRMNSYSPIFCFIPITMTMTTTAIKKDIVESAT